MPFKGALIGVPSLPAKSRARCADLGWPLINLCLPKGEVIAPGTGDIN